MNALWKLLRNPSLPPTVRRSVWLKLRRSAIAEQPLPFLLILSGGVSRGDR